MRSIIGIALAIFWVAVGFHCTLEAVPGFEFLHCEEGQSSSASGKGHCTGDGCEIVEAGKYLLPSSLGATAIPVLGVYYAAGHVADSLSSSQISRVLPEAAPPELIASWHFASRAALPIRAPSIN